ncbi:MAG: hypothetical protein J5877_04195 [Clostridia bacterium]|nr:hypothetical protein [Clostridia bacterium]
MKKKTVLTEIKINNSNEELPSFEFKQLNYGSRLLNYLSDCKKKKALISSITEEVDAIICCRASATILADIDTKNIKLIQLTSTGYDGVPVERLKLKGITVCNLKTVYDISIAETVVYGLIRYVKRFRNRVNNNTPKLFRHYTCMTELNNKNVLIMGAGNIGSKIADRLYGLNMRVIGYDVNKDVCGRFEYIIDNKEQLINELQEFDYIISTLPLVKDTVKFCDKTFFDAMSKTAVFFNIGRNDTVDSMSLYSALKNNDIGGAIIDTVELLPYPLFNRFRRLKNCLVLPGIATSSEECNERVQSRIIANLTDFFDNNLCQDEI